MRVVYLAGPYRAKTINEIYENVQRARKDALRLWKLGYAVICPHMNTALMDGALPDNIWLDGDLEILHRCDAIYLMEGWESSIGTCKEVEFAKAHNIPVRYMKDVTVPL